MGKTRSLKGIIQLDSELNKIQDVDILLEKILLEARRVVNADAGSIYVKDGEKLSIQYSQNDTLQKRLQPGEKLIYSLFSIPIDTRTISGYVAATGELLNIPDAYAIPPEAPYSYNTAYDLKASYRCVSMMTVPLKTSAGALLGVIQTINARGPGGRPVPFSQDDELFVTHFAANAAVALQRAYMTRAMVLRMIRMAELRDPKETGPHVNRVAGYAMEIYDRIAFRRGVPEREAERQRDILKMAAMLHDVGKVAISDLVLKKPGSFNAEERETIQGHTWLGARLFDDPQSEFDSAAFDVALNHHEAWDGSGYPGFVDPRTGKPQKTDAEGKALRRRGEEIPLFGRIVSVADVFDALMSRRVYKEPWPKERVYAEIKALGGKSFDPEVVDAFFDILPRIEQIRSRYPETESGGAGQPASRQPQAASPAAAPTS